MHSGRIWHLLARKFTGEATLSELRELEQLLLSDPELGAQAEIHNAYFECELKKDWAEEKRGWRKLLKRMQSEFPSDFEDEARNAKDAGRRRFSLSMTVVLLLLAAALFWQYPTTHSPLRYVGIKKAGTGENLVKRRIVLPDGSLVWLNKGSNVEYDQNFGIDNRELFLTGEAFFDVVHKAEMPMVVHAGLVDVKVIGTAFNVRFYPGDSIIETALVRGSIELVTKGKNAKRMMLQPNEKAIITMGSGSLPEISGIDCQLKKVALKQEINSGLIPEVAWIENKLVFSSEPFISVATKMARWHGVKIFISDSALASERFTGFFDNESLDEALNALKMTFDFNCRKDDNGNVYISK